MQDKVDEEITIDLVEIGQTLIKNIRFILKCVVGSLVVTGVYLMVASPTYESTAMLRIRQPQGMQTAFLGQNNMGYVNARQFINTYAEILKSRKVVKPVMEFMGEQAASVSGFVNAHIKTNPYKETEILEVKFIANDPELAQKANEKLLNSFEEQLHLMVMLDEQRVEHLILDKKPETKALEDTKSNTQDKNIITSKEKRYIDSMKEGRLAQQIYTVLAVQIVDLPDYSEKPIKPRKLMILAMALAGGLFLGCGIVVAKELLNRKIKTSADVTQYLELPILGQVPTLESLGEVERLEKMNVLQKLWRYLWGK